MESMPTVCVTGVSGFVAPHIVVALLKKGYRVHGTVRSLADPNKYDFLIRIAKEMNAESNLSLFEADNLKPGSFNEALQGCTYLIHMASPFIMGNIKNPMDELITPAVQGVENVLTSVAATPSIKRVIVTSSVAAIYGNVDDKRTHFYNEDDWNTTSTTKENPYHLSKTLAEKKAWELARQQSQYSLACINPGFVMGPMLNDHTDGESVSFMKDMLSGKNRIAVPHLEYGMVDVRDVAAAHVAAMENPAAQGRYICSKDSLSLLEVANILRTRYPHNKLPEHTIPKPLMFAMGPLMGQSMYFVRHNVNHSIAFDNKKIQRDLSIRFARPLSQTLLDMAESLERANLVHKE